MIGSTLGPYQVLAKLGEGGMGEVYRARGAQEAEHGADEHGDDPAAHVVIPRQLVPHAVG